MLTEKEMVNITGGGINWTLLSLLAAGLTLIAGILDGYLRPLRCNT